MENTSDNLISIIMCSKNSALTIRKSLDSLVSQDYASYELIVVDAQSTDGTLEVLSEYNFPRLKVVQQRGLGIYNAFNTGVKNCQGEYIYFLHTDDRFSSCHVLADFSKSVEAYQHDIIYGDVEYENVNGEVIRNIVSKKFIKPMLDSGFMPPHTGTFVKRNIFTKYGYFDEDYRISGDYEWLLRVLLSDVSVEYLPKKICTMTIGGVSNASAKARLVSLMEDMRAVRKHNVKMRSVFYKKLSGIKSYF